MPERRHGDHLIVPGQADAPDPGGGAAYEHAHGDDREADAFAAAGGQQDVLVLGAGAHAHQAVAGVQLHGDLAVGPDVDEIAKPVAPHVARRGGEHDEKVAPGFLVLGQGHQGGNGLAFVQGQQVDHGLAARLRGAQRQLVHLQLIDDPGGREEQHRRVGVDHEDLADEVLVAHGHAGAALAAAMLGAVGRKRHPLDVAGVGDGDHHVLALDEVLDVVFERSLFQRRAARRGEPLPDLEQLGLEDLQQPFPRCQYGQMLFDLAGQLFQVVADLVALQPRQALQTQLQNGLGLDLRKPVAAVLHPAPRLVQQRDHGGQVRHRPGLLHEPRPGGGRVARRADDLDHLVDVGHGHGEAGQHVGPVPGLAQLEDGAPADDLFTERNEGGDDLLQVHRLRLAATEGQHVDAEAGLQGGVAVELVEHHVGHGVALDLHHHAHAVAVRFIAQLGDALDLLVAHGLGQGLHHARLVHLIGYLGNDDGFAVLADFLDGCAPAHDHRPAPGVIGETDALFAEDDGAGGKVGSLDVVLHQRVDGDVGIVDEGAAGVDHLAQVMGRNVGGHADRDSARPVDQQVGKLGREHRGLALGLVVVGPEVDGVLVDVLKQGMGGAGQPRLGIAHGRRPVAVHGAEVALPGDERQTQRKVLGHAHHGVVNGAVAVGVVFAHDLADDARRLAEGAVVIVAALLHGIEDPPVHRLEPVAHVGQRPADDYAHGVIQVGRPHLAFDGDRRDVPTGGRGRDRCQRELLSAINSIGRKGRGRSGSEYGRMKTSTFRPRKQLGGGRFSAARKPAATRHFVRTGFYL